MSEENRFDDDLRKRLQKLAPPDLEGARRRALAAARIRLSAGSERSSRAAGPERSRGSLPHGPANPKRRPWARRHPSGRAAALAGSALMAMALLGTLTAPGQAVAEWVGERFGIGQPGGEPTMSGLHHFADLGNQGKKHEYIVLATGEHAIGGRFELVTSDRIVDGNRCVELDRLSGGKHAHLGKGISGGACGPLAKRNGMTFEFLGSQLALDPRAPLGTGLQTLGGRISPEIDRVEVMLNGRALPVDLIEIEPEILARAGIDQPFKAFLTFTDDFLLGGIAVARGYDADGELVGERRQRLVSHVEMYRAICAGTRKRLRRSFDAEQERFAQVECERADALSEAAGHGSRIAK